MFTLTTTRGNHVKEDLFVFYSLADMKRKARATFAEQDVDAVTLYAPSGKVMLQLVK